jgi:RNA polymerase sigma factor (sigma-70 family)
MVFSRQSAARTDSSRSVSRARTSLEAREGPLSDQLRQFLDGDRATLAHIEALVERVVRFRGYYVPSAERADVVQEVMLDVWQAVRAEGFALSTSLEALVRTISYRVCIDWVRRRRQAEEVDPETRDGRPGPERELLQRERVVLGIRVLKELRPPCRDLLRLFIVQGSTYREIAEKQGRTEGALRTQMAQCLKEAKEHLSNVRRRVATSAASGRSM